MDLKQYANVLVNYRPQIIAHQVYGNHNQVKPKFVSFYEFNKDNPFIELFFHYNLNNRSYLSPISFGRPDPIEEFAQNSKQVVIKKIINYLRNLEAKMRTFAQLSLEVKNHKVLDFGDLVKRFIKNFFQSFRPRLWGYYRPSKWS